MGLAVAEGVEVAAAAELHDGAGEVRVSIEVGVEGGEERVVEGPQDPPLRLGPPQLLLPRQLALVHHLHRVVVLGLLFAPPVAAVLVAEPAEIDRADVPPAQSPDELEIPRAHVAAEAADGDPGGVGAAMGLPGGE